jgi:hypothetical protein
MEMLRVFMLETVNKAMQIWGKYFLVGYGRSELYAGGNSILQILELKSGEYSCVLP